MNAITKGTRPHRFCLDQQLKSSTYSGKKAGSGRRISKVQKINNSVPPDAPLYLVWVLRGRPGSFMSEFNEANKRRDGMVFLMLHTVVIAAVIYINNR